MRRTSALLCASLLLGVLPLSGCYVTAHPVVEDEVAYEGDPPPPPPPQAEVVPVSPGPEFVWIGGFHRWEGRRYVWVGGHYERRPHPTARYVAPHWEARGRAHVWVRGHWH